MTERRPPPPPLRAVHARRQRAGAREGQDHPRRRAHPRPRGRGRPRRQGRGPRPRVRRRRVGRVRPPGDHHPGQRPRHRRGTPTTCGPSPRPGRPRVVVPKINSAADVAADRDRPSRPAGAPDHTRIWAMLETPIAMLARRGDRRRPASAWPCWCMGTNDLAKELHAEHVPGRQPLLHGPVAVPAGRPHGRQGDPRRRLQRHQGRRRLPGRVRAGPPAGLRRQDADPPQPGRAVQRRVRPRRRTRSSSAATHHRRLRGGRGRRARAWSPSTAA